MQDLICISHLRWGFVWQRPQHLLSRLARHYRVFFVEEPVTNTEIDQPRLEVVQGEQPVVVIRLLQPAQEHRWIGHNDPQTQETYERLLGEYLQEQGSHDPIVWLYTPMAAPFVAGLNPRLLVYDVMDELSAFQGAPAALREQDRFVLQNAAVGCARGCSL